MYQVNFLPWRTQNTLKQKRLFFIFAFMMTVLFVSLGGYWTILQTLGIAQSKIRHAHHQEQRQKLQQLKHQVNEKQQQLEKLLNRRKTIDLDAQYNQSLLNLLTSLTSIIPEKSWLSSFQLREQRLELKAHSYYFQDIHQLSSQLMDNPHIDHVQLIKLRRIKALNQLHVSANFEGGTDE